MFNNPAALAALVPQPFGCFSFVRGDLSTAIRFKPQLLSQSFSEEPADTLLFETDASISEVCLSEMQNLQRLDHLVK
jgi:hypothetical protein